MIMTMQPTIILVKPVVILQTPSLAPEKKYGMLHNIHFQFATKNHYKEHIPGKADSITRVCTHTHTP